MYIYKTTNKLNNKVYIGKSTKPYNENYLGSGKLLIKAVKKYGVKNFFVEVIDTADNLKDLNDKEKYWILLYKNNSYNIAEGGTGGDTMSNHPNKKEHYKKIGEKVSKKLTGHLVSDSSKLKQSKSHTGWFNRLTEIEKNEYRDKISKKMKELYKNGHHSKGKKLSDEHKNNLKDKQYAQHDPILRNFEKDAYLKGSMLFRDWEDYYKNRRKDSIKIKIKH